MDYITASEWDYVREFKISPIQKRSRGNQKTKIRRSYLDMISAFDIETTRLHGGIDTRFAGRMKMDPGGQWHDTGNNEQAIMYVWMLNTLNGTPVIGRTWAELKTIFEGINEILESRDANWVVWVHNLSYEFSFLRAIHDFKQEEVFAVDSRKILKCEIGRIEFRCSYLHSNMSLSEYTRKMGVEHVKLSGEEFDYSKVRYPWTPLDENEIAYCLHDVIGLCEALAVEMKADGHNLYTIPATSTGYVRTDVRSAMHNGAMVTVKNTLPPEPVYVLLREAFRGGNTHANRYYSGRIVENVKAYDRSSSYPDCQVNERYPIGRWNKPYKLDYAYIMDLINNKHRAVVMRIALTNLRLRDRYEPVPYISKDKCQKIGMGTFDNGRVLTSDYIVTTVTDVDYALIQRQYIAENVEVLEAYYCSYGKLPGQLTDVTKKYYRLKTELKGVPGQEVYYVKAKNKLNSVYGMSAQKCDKQTIDYINGEFVERDTPLTDLLQDNYRRAFQSYAWGVWVTCWARARLQDAIDLVHHTEDADVIYCDTDSVYFIGDVDFTDLNENRKRQSEENNAVAYDAGGNPHYMGVYEFDKFCYRFATLGAKKYAYQTEPNGETHITIAGVTKKAGGVELDEGDEYGKGLERFVNLNPPFAFRKAGGTEAVYQDNPDPTPFRVDGHEIVITPNTVLRDSTYTLGITAEYEKLLENCTLPLDNWGFTV